MTKRWNLCTPVPYTQNGQEKTKWVQLGVMFPTKSGNGFNMILDAIPASVDGKYKIMAFEPKPQGEKWSNQGPSDEEIDDHVPY